MRVSSATNLCPTWLAVVLLPLFRPCSCHIGSACSPPKVSCGPFEHCDEGQCRLAVCRNDQDCVQGERCTEQPDALVVGGTMACVKEQRRQKPTKCAGGTAVLVNGQERRCNAFNPCPGSELCDPAASVCCQGLRVCRRPFAPQIDPATAKPRICVNGGAPCAANAFCERDTGFCCLRAGLGQPCAQGAPCATANAMCQCSNGQCACDCIKELGYTRTNRATCERSRVRLSAQCSTSAECRSAYSVCRSGRCQCQQGFAATTDGGCLPTSYACTTGDQPYMYQGRVGICDRSLDLDAIVRDRYMEDDVGDASVYRSPLFEPASHDQCAARERYTKDTCPSGYYCVPFFDVPDGPEHYKGVCCRSQRSQPAPKCPVGNPHSSSVGPNFGCKHCPAFGYYCHRDRQSTNMEICCPAPCVNPTDLYISGTCYPVSGAGEPCDTAAQCIGRRSADEQGAAAAGLDEQLGLLLHSNIGQPMQCTGGKCACARGYIDVQGRCIRAQCTIGTMGEPATGADGTTTRCKPAAGASQCGVQQACDPTFGVCCTMLTNPQNRCPGGYSESGMYCNNGAGCYYGQFCYYVTNMANGQGVCCRANSKKSKVNKEQ